MNRMASRAHFASHSDSEIPNLLWPAKLGVTPERIQQIYQKFPAGSIPLRLKANTPEGDSAYEMGLRQLMELIDPYPHPYPEEERE